MYKNNQGHLTVFCIVFVWLGGPPSPVRIMTQVPWFMYQNRLGPSGGIYYPNFVPWLCCSLSQLFFFFRLKPPTTPRISIVTHVKKRFLQMSFLVGIKNSNETTRTTTTRSWRLKTKEMKRKEKSFGSYIYCT